MAVYHGNSETLRRLQQVGSHLTNAITHLKVLKRQAPSPVFENLLPPLLAIRKKARAKRERVAVAIAAEKAKGRKL